MVIEVFCIVAVLLYAFYRYLIANNDFWKVRGVPGPKPTLAFGNIFNLMFGIEPFPEYVQRVCADYKGEPMFGMFLRRKPLLILQDPDLIKDILVKDFSKFMNRGFFKSDSSDPLTEHLFSLEAKRWRPMRSHFSPVFTSGKLKGMFSLILDCSNNLEQYLDELIEKDDIIEIREISAKFTTDVIGNCAFGIEMNSLSDKESEFRHIGKLILSTSLLRILKFRMQQITPLLSSIVQRILPYTEETKVLTRITKETIDYRQKNKIVRPDFMNILMELKEHPEKLGDIELNDGLLAAQAFIFFVAGFETSGTTITNILYELALNQDVQAKVRDEIKVFETRDHGEWKYETIKEMKYLDKVFQETLRKYPVLVILSRESTEEYTFENTKVTIPVGTTVWIPVASMQMDPDVYPDPMKFDPERFNNENAQQRHPMYYLPFGYGPRNCIGLRFAMFQVKIGIIKIIRRYKIDVCEKTQIPHKYQTFTFLMTPESVHLKVTKI